MIQKTTAFQISDGNTYATLEIAQRAELLKLLTPADPSDDALEDLNRVLDALFARLDDVKQILSCTGRRQRKSKGNGAARKRKVAAEVAK